jgi:outer membrane receptor protein involved in Fe transport
LGVYALIAVGLVAGQTALAQSLGGGALEGTVADSSGASLSRAAVEIQAISTHYRRSAQTDASGFFRVSDLPVGDYMLSVAEKGFAPYSHSGITLEVGKTVRLNIVAKPSSVTTSVTVSGQGPPLDVSQTSTATTVDRERIEELPVHTRNALDFVLIAPGVSPAPPSLGSATGLNASGFSFGGLRARSNSISIDGLNNSDEYSGANRTELSPEIVREFQVVNNGISPEYARGSINVVTRSGSNQMHGDAFIFGESGELNARNPVENESARPYLHRYRAGLSNGGPVVKDHTFYYWAFEQEGKHTEDNSIVDPSVAATTNDALAGGAFPRIATRQINTGFFPVAFVETEASGKINHQFGGGSSASLRYAYTNGRESSDAFNNGGLTDPSARGSAFTKDQSLSGSLVSVLTPEALNNFGFQVSARRATLPTNDAVGPEIDINGLVSFGRPYGGNGNREEHHVEARDTFTLSRGRHLLKSGFAVDNARLSVQQADGFGGVYIFPSVTDFLAGNADTFLQSFGNPSTSFGVTNWGAFGADHWSVASHLTFDFGLRYDFEQLPSGFHKDPLNLSPRVGLAYSPGSRWVLRAGFGTFYDRYVLASLNRALEFNGRQAFQQFVDGQDAATVFRTAQGGPLTQSKAGIMPSIFRPDPNLQPSYSNQASFEAEHEFSPNLTLSASVLLVQGLRLTRTRNINLSPPVILTPDNAPGLDVPNPTAQQLGREFFGPARRDPAYNDIWQIEDSAPSDYRGLTVTLNRRLQNEIEFTASYTLSKATDNASDYDEQPQNPFNLAAELGPSLNQQQQRFVLSGIFDLPFGEDEERRSSTGVQSQGGLARFVDKVLGNVELAPILSVGSSRPVNALVGLDSNRSHAFPLSARPEAFGRNTLSTPSFASVDFRVVKYFPVGHQAHLDLVAESFNLLNRTNIAGINPFFGSALSALPGFLGPIEGASARQIEFSIDLEY